MYVLKYLPVHVEEIVRALNLLGGNPNSPGWKVPVRVLSLGRGPGTDVIALKEFNIRTNFYNQNTRDFKITQVDYNKCWNNIAARIVGLQGHQGYQYESAGVFIMDILAFLQQAPPASYDLIILSYIVSELDVAICHLIGNALDIVRAKNAIVIFNDRPEKQTIDKIDFIKQKLKNVKYTQFFNNLSLRTRFLIDYPNFINPNLIAEIGPKKKTNSYQCSLIIEG
jgi:hypothetical protein